MRERERVTIQLMNGTNEYEYDNDPDISPGTPNLTR